MKPRARDLGLPFEGIPGPHNAITDVLGVQVGHTTLVQGESVRTGVTAILPRGKKASQRMVPAGWFSLNGNGEMTGTPWIDEAGFLSGPVMITNTHSVGVVRDAVIEWGRNQGWDDLWSLPVVAETWDGFLNDINGFHVQKQHVFAAFEGARSGAVPEGNVGGGTGMQLFRFKGGIGTASRQLQAPIPCTVGVLVQANYGAREDLVVCGVPVGRAFPDLMPEIPDQTPKEGSIITVVATDAPLLPHQLKRLAKRAALGLARTGSMAYNGSGDLFIAFSTSVPVRDREGLYCWRVLREDQMDALLKATVLATEEAIINALIAAQTMKGVGGRVLHAIPHDRLIEQMRKHNRLVEGE